MQIAVSIDNNKDVRILPVTPRDVQIGYPLLTEEIDSIKYGQLLVLKNEGLATVDISSFFPTKKYPFMQPGSTADGWEYVRWFRDNRKKLKPFRVVITSKSGKTYFNRLMSCNDFQVTGIDGNGDIRYTMSFEQYRK